MNIIDLLNENERKLISIKEIKKGNILFNENEECLSVGVILEGVITISSYTFEGKEIVYNTINSDGVFGNNLIFSDHPYYKGNVIAKTNVKLALINKNNLIKLLQNNQQFLVKYLEIQSNFSKELNSKIKLLSFNKAEERFLYFLYIHYNKISFKNISSLADDLFLTREATSRLISKMVKEDIIIRNKNAIIKKEG